MPLRRVFPMGGPQGNVVKDFVPICLGPRRSLGTRILNGVIRGGCMAANCATYIYIVYTLRKMYNQSCLYRIRVIAFWSHG